MGVLLAATALVVLATVVAVPCPLLLVLGGAVVGFAPGIPDVRLEPALVLVVLLGGPALPARRRRGRGDRARGGLRGRRRPPRAGGPRGGERDFAADRRAYLPAEAAAWPGS